MSNPVSFASFLHGWRYQSVSTTSDSDFDDVNAVRCEHCKTLQQTNSSVYQTPRGRQTLHSITNVILSCGNLVLAVILLLAMWRSKTPTGPIVQSSSDAVFGHIPVRAMSWQPDNAFTSSDPWDGAYWNNGSSAKGSTPWDTLFRSGWIAVENARSYGLSGGVPLREFASAQFKDTWSESAEGYNPAVIHQLHCVGILKHLIQAQASPEGDDKSNKAYGRLDALFEHGEHCIEYLRQSVMCAADLTLEPPQTVDLATKMIHGTSGWGTTHQCRDWDVVHDRIWERLVRIYHAGQQGAMVVVPDTS